MMAHTDDTPETIGPPHLPTRHARTTVGMEGIVAPVDEHNIVGKDNLSAKEGICVGRHAVTPVPVRGPDEKRGGVNP